MTVAANFQKNLRRYLENPDARFLIAVSGGIDSMVLLALAARHLKGRFAVAHVDHGIRGNESRADARFVRSAAAAIGTAFFPVALENVSPSEDSLRKARRAFLLTIAKREGYAFILTAHHADDVLETLLMRLIRGTGLTGLGSIAPRTGKFLRPLINVTRSQILQYARKNGVTFRQDTSNHSLLYFRNRVRHQLVPQIKMLSDEFGGERRLLERTVKLSNELRSVQRAVEIRVKKELARITVRTPFWIRVSRDNLLAFSPLERATLVRLLMRELGQATDQRSQVEGILRFLKGEAREWTLGRVRIQASLGFLYFTGPEHRKVPTPTIVFQQGNLVCDALGLRADVDVRYKDATARFPKPGDRIGRGKLKKRLLEWRIPEPERRLLPILADTASGKVFWHFPETNHEVIIRELKFPFVFRPSRA